MLAAFDEALMRHGQLHDIAMGLDGEGDCRCWFVAHLLEELVLERVGETPRRVRF